MKQAETHQAVISVGSNIEPRKHIDSARAILASETRLRAEATVIETAPVGYPDQANFLNGAFLIETPLQLKEFNAYLKEVERRLGRVKGPIRSGPRTIDLDIIMWDGNVLRPDDIRHAYVYIPVRELLKQTSASVDPDWIREIPVDQDASSK